MKREKELIVSALMKRVNWEKMGKLEREREKRKGYERNGWGKWKRSKGNVKAMRKTAKKLRKRKEDGDVRKTWGEWKRDTENEKNVVEAG